MWSLSNAFNSAFKKLDPLPQFKATAKLGRLPCTTAELTRDLRFSDGGIAEITLVILHQSIPR
jgi:hypothetical protein